MSRTEAKRLQDRWESLAREDAEFFIWTDVAKGADFAASGRHDVDRILQLAEPHIRARDATLEIGCGIGRLTVPMSRHFARTVAVDIAPTMLDMLAMNCSRAAVSNVTAMHAGGHWERLGLFDFVYSHIVFQHIEAWPVIDEYFRRIANCISPSGVFYVQFDTRARNLLYRVRNVLPDFLLRRTWIRGVRRIRRPPEQIVDLAHRYGFSLACASGSGTADTAFIFSPDSVRRSK